MPALTLVARKLFVAPRSTNAACRIRQLPRLLFDTGFGIGSHRSYVIADVGRAEFFSEQLTTWRRLLPVSGVISKGDADLLMNGLESASAAGTLFWANNFYTFI